MSPPLSGHSDHLSSCRFSLGFPSGILSRFCIRRVHFCVPLHRIHHRHWLRCFDVALFSLAGPLVAPPPPCWLWLEFPSGVLVCQAMERALLHPRRSSLLNTYFLLPYFLNTSSILTQYFLHYSILSSSTHAQILLLLFVRLSLTSL